MRNPTHILITGASSGLGAALAKAYAGPGVRLALHGRDWDRLAHVADTARNAGAEVTAHSGDVTDTAGMAAWIASCDSIAPLDLVIANAGISAGTLGGGESATHVKKIFAVNVDGVFNTVQPVLPLMIGRKRGQIAIVSSLAGFRGFPGAPAYCASKAAIRVYGEGLRGEMTRYNVAVNIVCPGFIKTPMTDHNPFTMPLIMPPERAAHIIRTGLAANRARIAFPFPAYALTRILTALPQPLMDFIAARTPRK